MPAASRKGDRALVPSDAHGCPACPHPATIGPAITGSPDVFINAKPAVRKDDQGTHVVCCGANTWKPISSSGTVFINGKGVVRVGDQTQHCGGPGYMIEGSADVNVGG